MPARDDSGARLRAARERAGLSQREAAKLLGVHYGSLNRYELGKMRVPADLLTRAEALADQSPGDADTARDDARTPADAAPLPAVSIPLHELTYWRGVIETEHRHLAGLNQSMEALLRMLRDATQGIGGFIASGVLPAPAPSVEESRARIRARSEEIAREQEPPEAKRA